jgi:hypothetical protein
MIRRTVAFVVLVGSTCAAFADEKDPVKEKLFKAKVAYDAEMAQFRKSAGDWFDKREEAARKAGDKKALDQIKDERKAFDEASALPQTAPAAIKQKHEKATKALETAYAEAVKTYTKAKKDTEAAAVEEAWKAFVSGNEVDLLALVDPKGHAIAGEWKKSGKALVGTSGSRLQLRYEPGEEYDIEVICRRTAGDDCFAVGLVAGERQVLAVIDSWHTLGFLAGLEFVDRKDVRDNVTTVKGQLFKDDKNHTITCSVRAEKIVTQVDGKVVFEFKGEFTRLSADGYNIPNKKALFFHIGPNASFQIDRIVVRPVKGKGTILK